MSSEMSCEGNEKKEENEGNLLSRSNLVIWII
jgi:hypothetical protein